jgi:CRP-like cAMP-binding protein
MIKEIENLRKYLIQLVLMDNETIEKAIKYLRVENICKNDYLIKEGQKCNKIAFISEGLFRIYYLKDGKEISTSFCKENSMICSFNSVANKIPSNENIQALENSVIVTLSSENIAQLYKVSAGWQTFGRLLTEKECFRLLDRANTLSSESALEKYKNLLRDQPDLIQRVSIQHLASYIGVSRETLSRIRSKV